MGVEKVGEKYRCNICGNEVTVIKVGGVHWYAAEKTWKKSRRNEK